MFKILQFKNNDKLEIVHSADLPSCHIHISLLHALLRNENITKQLAMEAIHVEGI